MIIYLAVILFLIFYNSKILVKENFNDYISKNGTLPVKGIFVLLVFFRHFKTYVNFNSFLDKPLLIIDMYLGQLIVAMFLFYSGYGIYEQIKINKQQYIKELPKKRLLKTFISFITAVFTFLVVDIIIGTIKKYTIKTILLSFIGWESIGNSNWYMFLVFILYILVYLSFSIFKNKNIISILTLVLFTFLYSVIILNFKPQHWMDTSFCFSLGIIYSYYQKKIERLLSKISNYFMSLSLSLIMFIIFYLLYHLMNNPFIYCLLSMIFCIIVVIITMKFKINNRILSWLGKRVFWIYIL